MKFKSDLKLIKRCDVGQVQINKLPQLYRASMEFAQAQGNPELNRLLEMFNITGKYKYVSIDTRSHMLMKGMFPCIPGWHCDDFYRPDTYELHGQPDLENVDTNAPAIHHLMVLGDCSRTEFLLEDAEFPDTKDLHREFGTEHPVYYHYDRMLEESKPATIHVEPNAIYTFGPTAFHRGQDAQHNGWRCFIRVTESNHRSPKDEVRYQTQVYSNGRVSW